MPFNTSIYQQIQPNIAGQLAGSINEFADRRARLSDLAMQREQQAVTQGYQNRAAQRVEEAYPAQLADLELKRKKEAALQTNLGLVNEAMRAGKTEEAKRLFAQMYPEEAAKEIFKAPKENDEGSPVKIVGANGKTYEVMSNSGRAIGEAPKPSALVNIGNLGTPIELTNREGKPVLVQMDKSGKIIPVTGYSPKSTKETQLSPQAQKEVFEADENAQSAIGVIDTLNQAKKLNNQAYSGYGALFRAKAASNFPGRTDPKADATIQLDNMIREQALSSLKLTFGGSPTEGERAMLLELQASTEKTSQQRAKIMDKAIAMADRKLKFNQQKAESLRGGTYFKESPISSPPQGASNIDSLLDKYK